MIGEFRVAIGWRILSYIFFPVLIGIFFYAGYATFRSEPANSWMTFFLAPLSIGVGLLFVYSLMDVTRTRLIIGPDFFSIRGIIGTETLSTTEIKGFRIDSYYIRLIPIDETKKPIEVTRYIESADQIMRWLNTTFRDLDTEEAADEENIILGDNKFGLNRQVREYRLKEAKRTARYINRAGVIIALWLLFYPKPYVLASLCAMAIPIAAMCAIYAYRGLIRFDERNNSTVPSIFPGTILPASALLVRALMDWNILEYQHLWISVSVATVVLTALFLLGTKELVHSTSLNLLIALVLTTFMLGYAYGTYVVANCLFDKSAPEEFTAEVVDKEIGSGRVTTYDVVVGPWSPETEPRELRVTEEQFDKLRKGDTIILHVKEGLLGTPWLYVVTD